MKLRRNDNGFSLVEILVVMVVLGLVSVAVYGIFLTTQRQAYTQDEVVEVQQNLRAALEYMVRDIRMAEFMTPAGETALVSAPAQMLVDGNGDGDYEDTDERPILSLVSATSMHGYARVTAETFDDPNSRLTLTLPPGTMQQFVDEDKVRVFRPVDLNAVTKICSIDGSPSGDQVVLDVSGTSYADGDVGAGDLLVLIPAGAADDDFPLQIEFRLVDDPSSDVAMNQLQRRVMDRDGNTIEDWQLIASKVSAIDLTYLNDAGDATTDLDKIVAIQITITGRTDATQTGRSNFSGVKQRSLSTTVKIHNRVTI